MPLIGSLKVDVSFNSGPFGWRRHAVAVAFVLGLHGLAERLLRGGVIVGDPHVDR